MPAGYTSSTSYAASPYSTKNYSSTKDYSTSFGTKKLSTFDSSRERITSNIYSGSSLTSRSATNPATSLYSQDSRRRNLTSLSTSTVSESKPSNSLTSPVSSYSSHRVADRYSSLGSTHGRSSISSRSLGTTNYSNSQSHTTSITPTHRSDALSLGSSRLPTIPKTSSITEKRENEVSRSSGGSRYGSDGMVRSSSSSYVLPLTSTTSRHYPKSYDADTSSPSSSRTRQKFESLSIKDRDRKDPSHTVSGITERRPRLRDATTVPSSSTRTSREYRLKSRERGRNDSESPRRSRPLAAYTSSSTGGSSGSSSSGNTGLRNLGNTCFMNSIIQCLSNTKVLKDYFVSSRYKTDLVKRSGIAAAFGEVISTIWSQSSSSTSPASLKRQVENQFMQFSGYRQHDSQEFLLCLLDGIHEDLNHCNRSAHKYVDTSAMPLEKQATVSWEQYCLRDYSKLVEMFVGQIVSTLTCLTCHEVSTVFEYFWDLSVPVNGSGSSVDSCLEQFTKQETLDGDERPKCDSCKTRRKMTKQYKIWRLPQILIVHLKRFKGGGRIRSKDATNVRLDMSLSVGSYLHQKSASVLGSQRSSYELYAVSNHAGGTGGGHYTASCRSESGSEWRYFNDSSVNSMSSSQVQSSDAYVLFYSRV